MARVDKATEEKEEARLANDPQYQEIVKKQVQKHHRAGDNDVAADV